MGQDGDLLSSENGICQVDKLNMVQTSNLSFSKKKFFQHFQKNGDDDEKEFFRL